jgi:hypothetical protein
MKKKIPTRIMPVQTYEVKYRPCMKFDMAKTARIVIPKMMIEFISPYLIR